MSKSARRAAIGLAAAILATAAREGNQPAGHVPARGEDASTPEGDSCLERSAGLRCRTSRVRLCTECVGLGVVLGGGASGVVLAARAGLPDRAVRVASHDRRSYIVAP